MGLAAVPGRFPPILVDRSCPVRIPRSHWSKRKAVRCRQKVVSRDEDRSH